MVRIPRETAKRINDHVTKYMGILEMVGDRPTIKARNNPGSFWDARTMPYVIPDDETGAVEEIGTIMELQKRIFDDPGVLERTVAHEVIHHRDLLANPQDWIDEKPAELDSKGNATDETAKDYDKKQQQKAHGASFREGAARINAIMGPNFVTAGAHQAPVFDERRRSAPSRAPEAGANKIILALGVGGLAFLTFRAITLRRQQQTTPLRSPSRAQDSAPQPQIQPARENQRGHYGKKPSHRPTPRENARRSYGKP